MASLSTISDSELLAHVPVLLTRERAATAELIEYLAEIDRRRLYLEQACASLRSFCIERLSYSEDEASKRVRVAHLVSQLPAVLDELRSGAIHLTGLFCSRRISPCRTPTRCSVKREVCRDAPSSS